MAERKKKEPTIEELLADIRDELEPVEGLSTGNIILDHITSVGGYPKGRITEQFGPPSSGKTTSAMQGMALELERCEQAGEGYVAYLDFEMAMDPKYANALGMYLDSPRLIYVRPRSFEEGANKFRQLLNTGQLRMAVFDSVAAMVTEAEQAADTGKANVADRAKMMHQFCRQIKGPLERFDCAAVFINHTMEKVDTTVMGQRMAAQGIKRYTQPGGKALPFYSSLRIEFQQIGNVKDEVEDDITRETVKAVQQVKVLAKVVKNKVGDPFRQAELRIRFGRGFSQEHAILTVLVNHGVVKKGSAGVYKFPEHLMPDGVEKLPQGENKVLRAMEEDRAWRGRLLTAAQEILASGTYDSKAERPAGSDEDGTDDYDLPDFDSETGEVLSS